MKVDITAGFNNLDDFIKHVQKTNNIESKAEARKKALSLIPLEKDYQRKIITYLNGREDVVAWKDAAGMYQGRGVPDIIAVKDGIFYGFEIKRPFIGKLSTIQSAFHDKLKKVGGRVFVVSYVSEVRAILDNER